METQIHKKHVGKLKISSLKDENTCTLYASHYTQQKHTRQI